MAAKSDPYFSYLLRLWQAESDDKMVWRASLESAQTAEQHHFATLNDLFKFLRDRTNEPAASGQEE